MYYIRQKRNTGPKMEVEEERVKLTEYGSGNSWKSKNVIKNW
jgi:hypothetical protein